MSDDISVEIGAETAISVSLSSVASGTLDGQNFHFQDVRAADIDYIHITIAGNGAIQTITTDIINPDVVRNASITMTNIDTPSGIVTIAGINVKGQLRLRK